MTERPRLSILSLCKPKASTITFVLLIQSPALRQVLRLLRMIKLLRLAKLASNMSSLNLDEVMNPAILRLFQLEFKILYIAHLITCVWIYIRKDESSGSCRIQNYFDATTPERYPDLDLVNRSWHFRCGCHYCVPYTCCTPPCKHTPRLCMSSPACAPNMPSPGLSRLRALKPNCV